MANVLTENETQLRRLQWRCRRGMLEMDLLLENFIPLYFQQLNAAEQVAFDKLLDYPDNELWATIADTEQANIEMTGETKHVVSLLRNCCFKSMS
jgi:antitoxin CptB